MRLSMSFKCWETNGSASQPSDSVPLTHSHAPIIFAAAAAKADILAAAIGRAKFVTADFIKPGAVVIDVGMEPR